MKKQSLFIGLGIIILIILIIVFSGKGGSKIADDNVLTVGAILPLTGPTAQFGEVFKDGLERGLANDPNIKVIYEDSKGDATNAMAAFQKLVTIDKVDMIVSSLSKPSIALFTPAKENKVPLLTTIAAAKNITSKDNDYVYRMSWISEQQADMFTSRVIEQGMKHVAVLQVKEEASQASYDLIAEKLSAAGVKVTYETFQGTDTDFRTQLIKVKQANPEAIGIITVSAIQWKNLVTQINEAGIVKPMYDVLGVLLNPGTPEALGSLGEGIYTMTTPFLTGDYFPEEKDKIVKATGKAPAGFTSFGYDTATLLKQMVQEKSTDRTTIFHYLKNLTSFKGITSPYSVDELHNIKPVVVRAQLINGAIIKSDK